MRTTKPTKLASLGVAYLKVPMFLLCTLATLGLATAAPALAAGEPHPIIEHTGFETDTFTNPNGIAVDESSGDVYVATTGVDEQQTVSVEGAPEGGSFALEFEGEKTAALPITPGSSPGEAFAPGGGEVEAALMALAKVGVGGVAVSEEGALPGTVTYTISFQGPLATTAVPSLACDGTTLTGGTTPKCVVATTVPGVKGSVYKFNAKGEPVDSASLASNALTGTATPAKSFAFPTAVRGTPAAIAVDNSTNPADPSAGDLYVMDAGHGVIDKFDSEGKYLSQITGFARSTGSAAGELVGLAVDANGTVRADIPYGQSEFDHGVACGRVR